MTDPTPPDPAPAPDPAVLDQAVIDAGREYAAAQMATPRDQARIDAARTALDAARAARYPSG